MAEVYRVALLRNDVHLKIDLALLPGKFKFDRSVQLVCVLRVVSRSLTRSSTIFKAKILEADILGEEDVLEG